MPSEIKKRGRAVKANQPTTVMYVDGKSDEGVVLLKSLNKPGHSDTVVMEGPLTKGNLKQPIEAKTRCLDLSSLSGLQRIRKTARDDKGLRFTALFRHITRRSRQVNNHLCIDALLSKPGAFVRQTYRDKLHPNLIYARTWQRLRDRLSEHAACRIYIRLLHLAHQRACETALSHHLAEILAGDGLPDAEALRNACAIPAPAAMHILQFRTADPAGYDALRQLHEAPAPPPTQIAHA